MTLFALISAALGFALLSWRMWPRRVLKGPQQLAKELPTVSIVVPARNEEAVLGRLLNSLSQLDYPQDRLELIVVDDCSDDRTGAIAREYGVRLISGQPRPEGWSGKQWACHQGALASTGAYLLFTDADTFHYPDSLGEAVRSLQNKKAQGLTVLPYHQSEAWWEKLCGPFHVCLLAATNPYGKPRPGQVYAIGQYLLFERTFYEKMGGHERVKAAWVEDIPLANAVLEDGGRWAVYTERPLFEVRMYASLGEFVRGWRRNFRAGMSYSYPGTGIEMTLFMAAFLGGGDWLRSGLAWGFTASTCLLVAFLQRRLGRFSLWGALLFPYSLLLFCSVSILALYDLLFKKPLVWKNRSYPAPTNAEPAS